MQPTEMLNSFVLLYNNIMSNAAPGLDNYEISMLLTKAQLELIKNTFTKKGNKYAEGFDGSAKRQSDFSSIIRVRQCNQVDSDEKYDGRGEAYRLPSDFFLPINEEMLLTSNLGTRRRQVIPLSYTQYERLMQKPYKEPLKGQAWRLQIEDGLVEIILNTKDSRIASREYRIRYVCYPEPIIVTDLHAEFGSSTNIEGSYLPSSGSLSSEMHQEIVQRAVEIAKATYSSDQSGQLQLQNQFAIGQRSE